MRAIQDYAAHVFDMDGVLLQSNAAKSEAFYRTALPYGKTPAEKMRALHQSAGSITRKERWELFFSEVLKREPEEGELERLIDVCSELIAQGVESASKLPGVEEYLDNLRGELHCVSGVEYNELRRILNTHRLLGRFVGVHGGRRGVLKSEVLSELVSSKKLPLPALYYGDTEDDYLAARHSGLDFLFVALDTEWQRWHSVLSRDPEVRVISTFSELHLKREPVTIRVPASGEVLVRGELVKLPRSLSGSEVTFS